MTLINSSTSLLEHLHVSYDAKKQVNISLFVYTTNRVYHSKRLKERVKTDRTNAIFQQLEKIDYSAHPNVQFD